MDPHETRIPLNRVATSSSPTRSPVSSAPAAKKPVAAWRPKFAPVAAWFLLAFTVGLLVQLFLAGYGLTEVGSQGLGWHKAFVHIIEIFPILIPIFGFIGADKLLGWGGVALFVQLELQYMFINLGVPGVRALHVVNGSLMLVVATVILLRRLPWKKWQTSSDPGA